MSSSEFLVEIQILGSFEGLTKQLNLQISQVRKGGLPPLVECHCIKRGQARLPHHETVKLDAQVLNDPLL
jgi:hypothetical protein